MKKVSFKTVYEAPRAYLVIIKAEQFICASTSFEVSIDDMGEDEYEWEI